jgi:hypothetical protein
MVSAKVLQRAVQKVEPKAVLKNERLITNYPDFDEAMSKSG